MCERRRENGALIECAPFRGNNQDLLLFNQRLFKAFLTPPVNPALAVHLRSHLQETIIAFLLRGRDEISLRLSVPDWDLNELSTA